MADDRAGGSGEGPGGLAEPGKKVDTPAVGADPAGGGLEKARSSGVKDAAKIGLKLGVMNHQHRATGRYVVKAREMVLEAEERFEIRVGAASIQMSKGGDVSINGTKVTTTGELTNKGKVSDN